MKKTETQQKKPSCRVLIVDDHPAAREGLTWRISQEPGMSVFGEASSIQEALELLHPPLPDLAVIDISLQDGSGIDLVGRIRSRFPQLPMLVWSMHSDVLYAERAIRAGALGYINKGQKTASVIEAIRTVSQHELYLSEATSKKMLLRSLTTAKGANMETPVENLSNRELQVFQLIGQGQPTSVIASRLRISVNTVETHRQRIKNKLHLRSGAELTCQASRWLLEHEHH